VSLDKKVTNNKQSDMSSRTTCIHKTCLG